MTEDVRMISNTAVCREGKKKKKKEKKKRKNARIVLSFFNNFAHLFIYQLK